MRSGLTGSGVTAAEHRISARADEASGDDQNDPEQNLTLHELNNSDDYKYRGNHPE